MHRIIILTIVALSSFANVKAQTTQPISKDKQLERIKNEKMRTPIKIDDALQNQDKMKPLSKKEKRKAKRKERREKCRLRKKK